MKAIANALHGFIIGSAFALLLFFGLVIFTFFEPFGSIAAYTATALYVFSFFYLYLFTRS